MKESAEAAARKAAAQKEAREKIVAEAQEYRDRVRREEAFERELAAVSVRRDPLGKDRFHNRYFWLPSLKGMVLVESPEGIFTRFKRKDELDALLQALNPKGVRELGLKSALEKKYKRIANSLQRSMTEAAAHHVKHALRQSSRRGHTTPSKGPPKGQGAVDTADEDIQGVALHTVETMELMQEVLQYAGSQVESGWKAWSKSLRKNRDDKGALVQALLELEGKLFEFSDQPVAVVPVVVEAALEQKPEDQGETAADEQEEQGDDEEMVQKEDEPHGHGEDLATGVHELMDSEMFAWRQELQGELGRLRPSAIWRTVEERQRWTKEVYDAVDHRAVLYYTLVLLDRADGVLNELQPKFSLTRKRAHSKTDKGADRDPKRKKVVFERVEEEGVPPQFDVLVDDKEAEQPAAHYLLENFVLKDLKNNMLEPQVRALGPQDALGRAVLALASDICPCRRSCRFVGFRRGHGRTTGSDWHTRNSKWSEVAEAASQARQGVHRRCKLQLSVRAERLSLPASALCPVPLPGW
eukprot:scaffold2734_cov350-Prasinococcus_capsulatus_cf.AAC.8